MGDVVMFSRLNAQGKRYCSVVGALLQVPIRGPSAASESELRCSAYKWHHFILVRLDAKVGCGLHVSQLQSRKKNY